MRLEAVSTKKCGGHRGGCTPPPAGITGRLESVFPSDVNACTVFVSNILAPPRTLPGARVCRMGAKTVWEFWRLTRGFRVAEACAKRDSRSEVSLLSVAEMCSPYRGSGI